MWNLWRENENGLQRVKKNKGSKENRLRCRSRHVFTWVCPAINKCRFEPCYWTLINSSLLWKVDSLNKWPTATREKELIWQIPCCRHSENKGFIVRNTLLVNRDLPWKNHNLRSHFWLHNECCTAIVTAFCSAVHKGCFLI